MSWLFSMSPSVNLFHHQLVTMGTVGAAPGRGWDCPTLTPLWPLLLCESWTRFMTCVSIKFPNRQNLSCLYYHCAYVIMWEKTLKKCVIQPTKEGMLIWKMQVCMLSHFSHVLLFAQSIVKETNPGCSLEGLMLNLKLQYFGHLMWITDSFEKMLGKTEGRRGRGW